MSRTVPIVFRDGSSMLVAVPSLTARLGQDSIDWGLATIEQALGASPLINAATGELSEEDKANILLADQAANLQAATNPVTGNINTPLLTQANAQSAAGISHASDVSNLSTGSWLGNLWDSVFGTYTNPVGLPGTTPSLGSPATNPLSLSSPTASAILNWLENNWEYLAFGGFALLVITTIRSKKPSKKRRRKR